MRDNAITPEISIQTNTHSKLILSMLLMVAGIMFVISGIAAAGLGTFADWYGIQKVFYICALLPLLGLANFWLPNKRPK